MTKNRLISIILCLFMFISLTSFIGCGKMDNYVVKLDNVLNGKTISFYDQLTTDYLKLSSADDTANYLMTKKSSRCYTSEYSIYWDGGTAPYTVLFSLDKTFNEIYLQKTTEIYRVNISINDYFTAGNTYYYKVIDANNNQSKIDSFTTDTTKEILNFYKVYNVRDLGGMKTSDGKTIKYGKLIRGGKLENADTTDIALFRKLGVRTDLDLRGAVESEKDLSEDNGSPIHLSKYYLTKINTYDDIIEHSETQSPLYKRTFEILCYQSNYPIYFHCTWGADRTGMVAMLIEGVLGVSLDDIYKDYEFTSFYPSAGARWRSNIVQDEQGAYHFDDSGVQRSDVRFGLTITKLLSKFSDGTNNFQLACKNYLLSIGITETQINTLVDILTE